MKVYLDESNLSLNCVRLLKFDPQFEVTLYSWYPRTTSRAIPNPQQLPGVSAIHVLWRAGQNMYGNRLNSSISQPTDLCRGYRRLRVTSRQSTTRNVTFNRLQAETERYSTIDPPM